MDKYHAVSSENFICAPIAQLKVKAHQDFNPR
jgi:hypothetical protein